MFKSNGDEDSNDYNGGQEDTVIGSSIKIEGDLKSNGSIVVEGEVSGSIQTEQDLRIGDHAKVVADVTANNAKISGTVQGNVKIKSKLSLASSAQVNGDIEAAELEINPGAVFNGKCSMTEMVKDQKPKNAVASDEEEQSETDEQ
jgi:cytoskeletal protein CcmA (bactofilin family)